MNIATNRKAFHDYHVEDKYEAGIVLQGWEIKSIRAGKAQIKDSYVKIKNGEVWLIGCQITPLISASTHVTPDPMRIKKLLLNKKEIDKLIGKVEQRGYSLIALNLHYKKGVVKTEIALAKGKKLYDKRKSEKEKELKRESDAAMKQHKRL